MPRPFFEPVKINLVEHKDWEKHFDPAGRIQENAFNYAIDSIGTLQKDDLLNLADDVFNKDRKKVRSFTEEEEDAIWEAFRENSPELEAFNQMILDAFTWDYEHASMPTDEDITDAIDRAIEAISYNDYLESSERLEEVQVLLNYDGSSHFVQALLHDAVRLEHTPGHYDRFLVYDPPPKPFVEKLSHTPGSPPGGVFEWAPSVNMIQDKEFMDELRGLIKSLKDDVVAEFFTQLVKIMDDVDLENRMDFMDQWRNLLGEPSSVRAAKESITEVIKKGRKK